MELLVSLFQPLLAVPVNSPRRPNDEAVARGQRQHGLRFGLRCALCEMVARTCDLPFCCRPGSEEAQRGV